MMVAHLTHDNEAVTLVFKVAIADNAACMLFIEFEFEFEYLLWIYESSRLCCGTKSLILCQT